MFHIRPSELIGLDLEDDAYTAFCFDEACYTIIARIEKGDKPVFDEDIKPTKVQYTSAGSLFKSLNLVNAP